MKKIVLILTIISLFLISSCFQFGDSEDSNEAGNQTNNQLGMANVSRYDLSNAKGLVIIGSQSSSRNEDVSVPVYQNTLYQYTQDGNLEVVNVYADNGEEITENFELVPKEIIDLGTKLAILYGDASGLDQMPYTVAANRTVFVDKATGDAYLLSDNEEDYSTSIPLHYNSNESYRQVYSDNNENIYIYIDSQTVAKGFYKISFNETSAVMNLIFEFTVDCNSPTFLVDYSGNIVYEDSCKPWKIFTSTGRMSTITPDTFNYTSFLGSANKIYNGKLSLNEDGMGTTTFTNTDGITVWQSDKILTKENYVYIANNSGVIAFDESSTDLDNNVKYYYLDPLNSLNSQDFNSLEVKDSVAYIATNTGISTISLNDINNVQYTNNILDDVYKVTEMQVFDDHILFSGQDPYLDNISAKYDFSTGAITVLENHGRTEASFNLIKIN